MNNLPNIITIIVITGSLITFYLLFFRLPMVSKFRRKIELLCREWNDNNIDAIGGGEKNAYEWLWDQLPSLNRMQHSLKPLKLKYWISKEKLEKLLS